MKIILGIDPGSHITGFGVIHADQDRLVCVRHGTIVAPAQKSFVDRLRFLAGHLDAVFTEHRPNIAVVERIFMGRNADSAFKLGHMRGICLLAAARHGADVVEYAARSVKKGVTGSGAATKEQVQLVLFAALGLKGPARVDASDALALAYYHAREMDVLEMLARQNGAEP